MTPRPTRRAATAATGASWDWLRPAAQMAAPAGEIGSTDCARVATRTLSLEPASVCRARDFALATVRRWGMAPLADDIGIVVSELLTNALRHASQDQVSAPSRRTAGWPIRLGLLCPGNCVLCAVADPSDDVPAMREPDYLEETGRGLHVIASLSEDWGWTTPGQDGKVVWALFVPEWRFQAPAQPAAGLLEGSAGGESGASAESIALAACSPVAAFGAQFPAAGLASPVDSGPGGVPRHGLRA
jgi:Histidine kinase-like ATPase domain